MEGEVRVAEPGDLDRFADAFGPEQYHLFRSRASQWRRGLGEILVALRDGRPVGAVFVSWDVADEPAVRKYLPGVPVIFHLHVAAAHRRQGVGTGLIRAAERRLRGRGHTRVLLGVDESNRAARRFYLRLGYVQPDEPALRGLHAPAETYDILVADLNRA
ncbi:GNAT family N-acetyltransferase [Jidongwangia harbinensis]|uniref:GNAT family N-acetyltransferase n=1 Tax=Jidongwangia harbinensis TaxID=2878561 RepID=UPI001CD94B4E|nr:GNAT family N-acetyltransferase [Jidongwangia harbinensis]MCA2218530.1 GNAT family N-acetyltransferase [Jidongwangia harbinensis]